MTQKLDSCCLWRAKREGPGNSKGVSSNGRRGDFTVPAREKGGFTHGSNVSGRIQGPLQWKPISSAFEAVATRFSHPFLTRVEIGRVRERSIVRFRIQLSSENMIFLSCETLLVEFRSCPIARAVKLNLTNSDCRELRQQPYRHGTSGLSGVKPSVPIHKEKIGKREG